MIPRSLVNPHQISKHVSLTLRQQTRVIIPHQELSIHNPKLRLPEKVKNYKLKEINVGLRYTWDNNHMTSISLPT